MDTYYFQLCKREFVVKPMKDRTQEFEIAIFLVVIKSIQVVMQSFGFVDSTIACHLQQQ